MPGMSPATSARAIAAAKAIDPARFDEAALKRHEVGEAASVVSAIPGVRAALFNFQQEFAAAPPGAVLDGRDIGTVICPNAEVKIFVTATPRGPRPPPRHWSCGGGARTPTRRTSWPTSRAATNATAPAPPRR